MKYYWVVKDVDWADTARMPMLKLPSKYKYNFELGDRLYLDKGYLGKRKAEEFFYPVKYGKNLTLNENFILFHRLFVALHRRQLK